MQQLLKKYAIRIFSASAAIALALLWIGYRQPVRAYLLTRGDERIIVVGETHMHTPLEFDRYTNSIIVPALLASRRALFEGALPENNQDLLRSLYTTPCSNPTAPSAINGVIWNHGRTVYRPDTIDAVKKFIKVVQEKNPAWLATMAKSDAVWREPEASKVLAEYDEIALLQFADDAFVNIAYNFYLQQKRPPLGSELGLSNYLWVYLDNLNKKFNIKPKQSRIEIAQDRWVSTCQATPEHRDEFIRDMFLHASKRVSFEASNNSYTYEPGVIDAVSGLLSRTLSCINSDTLCVYTNITRDDALEEKGLNLQPTAATYLITISNRNKIIASRIISEVHQYKRVFVIIGSSHLADFMVDGTAQKGLLSMLADEGFSIKPIRYRWNMRGFMH